MAFFSRLLMMTTSSAADARPSSTTYWMAGRSTTSSISFGWAFVAGKKRVPRPAAGMRAFMGGKPFFVDEREAPPKRRFASIRFAIVTRRPRVRARPSNRRYRAFFSLSSATASSSTAIWRSAFL